MPKTQWFDTAVWIGVGLFLGMLYVLGDGGWQAAFDMEVRAFDDRKAEYQKSIDDGLLIDGDAPEDQVAAR